VSAKAVSLVIKVLLTPRWLVAHLLALSLVVALINLGLWQLRRLEERTATNALLAERLDDEPQAYSRLTEAVLDPEALRYRPTVISGRFDPSREVLLRSRSHQGQPGWHVLTPLLLAEERALLVNRGWVPFAMDTLPLDAVRPPEAEVTVWGRLQPSQRPPDGWLAVRDPPEGVLQKVFWIDTERLARQFPYRLEPFYLELIEQQPATPGPLPVPPPPPVIGTGPHLSYALQFFAFALVGIVGYGLLLRRVLTEHR